MTTTGRLTTHTTSVVRAETPLLLAHPQERPKALIAALARELATLRDVKGAWLMLAIRPGEPAQTWMLGVETGGPWGEVQAALGRAIDPRDLDGLSLDAVETGRSGLSEAIRGGIPILPRRGLRAWLGL